MSVKENVISLLEEVEKIASSAGRDPDSITIVGVTKTVPLEKIKEAYDAGLRHFGENRVQEAREKISFLEAETRRGNSVLEDAVWHMVGHLQKNKVKYAVKLFQYIHSLDSFSLVDELVRRLRRLEEAMTEREESFSGGMSNEEFRLKVFVEVKTDPVPTKHGVSPEEVPLLTEYIKSRSQYFELLGLMTVAPSDRREAAKAFSLLRKLAEDLKLPHLSMGMSNDYDIAIKEGATFLRIGRRIFGERL